MHEKIKDFFEKIGLWASAIFLSLLVFLGRKVLQNHRIGIKSDSDRDRDFKDYGTRIEQSASRIEEIIRRVKERGGEGEK